MYIACERTVGLYINILNLPRFMAKTVKVCRIKVYTIYFTSSAKKKYGWMDG